MGRTLRNAASHSLIKFVVVPADADGENEMCDALVFPMAAEMLGEISRPRQKEAGLTS